MKYERTVDPAVYPISLTDVEEALNLPPGTDTDRLNSLIESSTDDLERDIDMALISQTWRFALDKFPSSYYDYTIFIPKGTTISVSSFTYQDTDDVEQTLVDGTDYEISQVGTEARIIPIDSWADTYTDKDSVVVLDVVLGIGTSEANIPGWVKEALILKIKAAYEDCYDKFEKPYNSAVIKRKLFFVYSKNDR
jgi:uncharacterized phiE125 gp8 family phage protein